jgi:membrane protein YdbS with pleckstrin-like domain
MRLALAVLGAAAVAVAMFIGLFAAAAGFAWIYLFGDDPWPDWSGAVLLLVPAVVSLISAIKVFQALMRRRTVD